MGNSNITILDINSPFEFKIAKRALLHYRDRTSSECPDQALHGHSEFIEYLKDKI